MSRRRKPLVDPQYLNKPTPTGTAYVSAEMIRSYARALGMDEASLERSPDGRLVAPSFLPTAVMDDMKLPDVPLPMTGREFLAGLAFEPYVPVLAGDTLHATTALVDVYEKTGRSGSMLFFVFEISFTNQRGERVASLRESLVQRS